MARRSRHKGLEAIEDAYDNATGSWTGWDWPHDPSPGEVTSGPGDIDDWTAWESARVAELRELPDHLTWERQQGWKDAPLYPAPYTNVRAREIAAAERKYGEAVQEAAEAAEEAAADALRAARRGDWDTAVREAKRASSIESDYGDDPTWGTFATIVEETAERQSGGRSRNPAEVRLLKTRCMRG
jgi:hypothetical protein